MSDDQASSASETVEAYYQALRNGDPLGPFFAEEPEMVKVGISETLVGHDAIVEGLADQTATTTDWTVESRDRHVTEREDFAWYHDDVSLGWRDTASGRNYDFETRWTGSLRADDDWQFVTLHVSTAGDLD